MDNYEKVVNIDLELHNDAAANDRERYDAALPIISLRLFKKNMGSWMGRETSAIVPEDGYILSNYWYVLESCMQKAKKEIEEVVQNFNLGKFTRITVSHPVDYGEDFKLELEETKTLEWFWDKN
ncbi:hypothetical protein [Flagellimonas marinaquae]|jgi:hypothetical protein